MSRRPHEVTRQFEAALCEYTGARFAVTTTSCTSALLLACMWHRSLMRTTADVQDGKGGIDLSKRTYAPWDDAVYGKPVLQIPKRTYVGVGMSALNAGFEVKFLDEDWQGEYQLRPYPIWDAARRFTLGMYRPGAMQCVSFHWSKILGLSQGGAILHDSPEADVYLRRARFDGRREGVPPAEDTFDIVGQHCYLSPEVAAHGLMRLSLLPRHNADLPRSEYSDLSLAPIFGGNP